VVERIGDVYVERRIEETQETYPRQVDLIFDLYESFKPEIISIDNTGHGIVVGDMLVEKLRTNNYNPGVLKRVTFTQDSKERMAVGFRNMIMPDPVNNVSRYRWLYKQKKHEEAIRHCMRVEKEVLPQSGIRYSGKMHGRDDHFWSKAQIALIEAENILGLPKAAFGRYTVAGFKDPGRRENQAVTVFSMIEKSRETKEISNPKVKATIEHNIKLSNISRVINTLKDGLMLCTSKYKMVKPIHCAFDENCADTNCSNYQYVVETCKRNGINRDDLKKYKRDIDGTD
jgi:hypothetical protein